jgi:hypothetical protein
MREGSTQFFRGEGGVAAAIARSHGAKAVGNFAEFQWRSESLKSRVRQLRLLPGRMRRLGSQRKGLVRLAPFVMHEAGRASVLGTEARVFVHPEEGEPLFEAIAVWGQGDEVLELRSFVPDLQIFKQRLARLRRVDAEVWLQALQGTVLRAGGGRRQRVVAARRNSETPAEER